MSSSQEEPQKTDAKAPGNVKGKKALAKKSPKNRGSGQPKAKSHSKKRHPPPKAEKAAESGKEEDKVDERHQAEILSDSNKNAPNRLVLSSKVTNVEFMKLAGMTSRPLVNGTKHNAHAYEAGSRLIRIWEVIDEVSRRGLTVSDVQGKPRGGAWLNGASLPYPPCHSKLIVPKDSMRFINPCNWQNCNHDCDVVMMVDTLTHMTPLDVLNVILWSKQRTAYFVYNDLYRTEVGRTYRLVSADGSLRYLRDIRGHSDNNEQESDLYQPWLMDGHFMQTVEGVSYTVTFEPWGPCDDRGGSILRAIATVSCMEDKVPERIKLDGNFWDFASSGNMPVGRYEFAEIKRPVKVSQRLVDVTKSYTIFWHPDGVPTVMHANTMLATIKSHRAGPVTSASERTAKREVTTTLQDYDKKTIQETLSSNVSVDMKSEQATARLGVLDRVFPATNIDQVAVLAAKLDPVVNTDPVAPSGMSTFLPSLKHISALMNTLPKLVSVIPIAVLMARYAVYMIRKKVVPPKDDRTFVKRMWDRFSNRIRWDQAMQTATGRVAAELTTTVVRTTLLRTIAGYVFGIGSIRHLSMKNRWYFFDVPLVEELSKSTLALLLEGASNRLYPMAQIHPQTFTKVASTAFGVGEFVDWMLRLPFTFQLLSKRLGALAMHTGVGWYDYPTRVAIHCIWNAAALYLVRDEPSHNIGYVDASMGPVTGSLDPYRCKRKDVQIVQGSTMQFTYAGKIHKYPFSEQAWSILEQLEGKRRPIVPNQIVYWPYFPGVQAKEPMSFVIGMLTRVMKNRPLAGDILSWKQCTALALKTVNPLVKWFTFEEWNSRYPGQIKTKNLKAINSLLEGDNRTYSVAPFNKDELNHTFVALSTEPKDPRIICGPAKQEAKVLSGPFYYSVNQCINASWDGVKSTTFQYGLGSGRPIGTEVVILAFSGNDVEHPGESQIQRFSRFVNNAKTVGPSGRKVSIAVAGDDNYAVISCSWRGVTYTLGFWTDGVRWDSSIKTPALDAEFDFYTEVSRKGGFTGITFNEEYYVTMADIARLHDDRKGGVFACKHFADLGVEFKGVMPPIRHSGDQNTTGGNNVLNVSGCLRASGLVLQAMMTHLLDDDSTDFGPEFIHAASVAVKNSWLKLGIDAEVGMSMDLTDGDFCSSLLIPNGGKLYGVPKIGRFLCRSGFSLGVPRTVEEIRAQLTQFEAFLNVPFLGDHLAAVREQVGYGEESDAADNVYNFHFGSKDRFPVPDATTWDWFFRRYGVTEAHRIRFQMMLSSVTTLPYQLDGSEIEPIFRVDLDVPTSTNIVGEALAFWPTLLPYENFWIMPKTKKNVKPAKGARPKAPAIRGSIGIGPNTNNTSTAKPNRSPAKLMQRKISGKDASVASYMLGLTTPGLPCRVPVVLGEFELDTNTYSYVFNGTFAASSAGFGYIFASNDGWVEAGNDTGPATSYCAWTTGGYPVYYTPPGGAATVTPAVAGGTSASIYAAQLPKLDNGFTNGSRYRCTAVILSVWVDSPATTTQGDLVIASCACQQAADDAALNNASFATIAGYPQEYVTHMEMGLPNWPAGAEAHVACVPYSENCFVIQTMAATGYAGSGSGAAVAVISGAAVGQTMRYRLEYKYETTAPLSYMTGMESMVTNTNPVEMSTLQPHIANIRPMSVSVGSGLGRPGGDKGHLPAVALSAIKKTDPSLFDRIVGAATAGGLGGAVKDVVGTALSFVPKVGNALSSTWNAFFNYK